MNKFLKLSAASISIGLISQVATAILINFDDQGLTGPSTFAAAGPAQTIDILTVDGTVRLEGGVILDQTSFLPANQSAVYGTAFFGNQNLNPLTMTFLFADPIENFFLDVFNGQTSTRTFEVADNDGNIQTFDLSPNTSSGATVIGIPATGSMVTVRDITGGQGDGWDFFVDNINFNTALPPELPVPEAGSSFLMLSFSLAGFFGVRRLLRKA